MFENDNQIPVTGVLDTINNVLDFKKLGAKCFVLWGKEFKLERHDLPEQIVKTGLTWMGK